MADVTTELLKSHFRQLRLPTMGKEFEQLARDAASSNQTFAQLLLRLTELELAARAANAVASQGLRISLGRLGVVGRSGPFLFCGPAGWGSSPSCTIDRQDNPTASGTSAP